MTQGRTLSAVMEWECVSLSSFGLFRCNGPCRGSCRRAGTCTPSRTAWTEASRAGWEALSLITTCVSGSLLKTELIILKMQQGDYTESSSSLWLREWETVKLCLYVFMPQPLQWEQSERLMLNGFWQKYSFASQNEKRVQKKHFAEQELCEPWGRFCQVPGPGPTSFSSPGLTQP